MLLQHILTYSDSYTNIPDQNPRSDSHWLDVLLRPITEPIAEGTGQECCDWLRPGSWFSFQSWGMGNQPPSNWWTGHWRGLLQKSGLLLPQRGTDAREAKLTCPVPRASQRDWAGSSYIEYERSPQAPSQAKTFTHL